MVSKTRDLIKKIRDIKGIFHAKMGSIRDRNGMDLTEQKILRRGGKNIRKRTSFLVPNVRSPLVHLFSQCKDQGLSPHHTRVSDCKGLGTQRPDSTIVR